MAKQQINKKHGRYVVKAYTVVEFVEEENDDRLFEAIPDTWFTDDTKKNCYWPPKTMTSKSLMICAVNCARPDDSWNIYDCIVVSEGHVSYASAYKIVREKVSQKYNTSSADDRLAADSYRRKHPVLAMQGDKTFESVFSTAASKRKADQTNANGISETNGTSETNNQLLNDDPCEIDGKNEENVGVVGNLYQSRGNSTSKHSQQQVGKTNGRATRNETDPNQKRVKQSNGKKLCSKSDVNAAAKTSIPTVTRSNSNESDSNTGRSLHAQSQCLQPHISRSRGNSQGPSRNARPRSESSSRSESSRSRLESCRSRSESSRSRSGSSRSRSESSFSRSGSFSSRSRTTSGRTRPINSSSSESDEQSPSSHLNSKHTSKSTAARTAFGKKRQTNLHENSGKRLVSKSLSSRTSIHTKKRKKRVPLLREPKKNHVPETRSSGCSPTRDTDASINSDSYGSDSPAANIEHSNPRFFPIRSMDSPPSTTVTRTDTESLSTRVDSLKKLALKCDQRQDEQDRRLTRIEVTLNKTFVMVGDLINVKNSNVQHATNNSPSDVESEEEFDFDEPKLPITSLGELDDLKIELRNRRYKRFLIMHERDYCTPSTLSTHTVTMTKYLSRFVSMGVRCELTLKEKSKSGVTLMRNYKRVYQFLIAVFRAGYRICNKFVTRDEAHAALRTVWGRSKQYQSANDKRKQDNKKKISKRSRRRH